MNNFTEKIKVLREYFLSRPDISMVFAFGSCAVGRDISESDFDLGIYFAPKSKDLEWEEDIQYPQEDEIWRAAEKIVHREVDLVILNRASAGLCWSAVKQGTVVIIKDENLYWRWFNRISFDAIDFQQTVDDWMLIKQRSASLSAIDRQRLLKLIDFMERELADKNHFNTITWQIYQNDSDKRRNLERWVENIVNCSIDMAKILLASEKNPLPDTYKEILHSLALLPDFSETIAEKLSEFAKLRNILAHEYLDMRFNRIEKFLQEFDNIYPKFLDFCRVVCAAVKETDNG
jgi:uncharacterized protein YutE (UPF0331/DUF86 family)/predicted nucleotidyltransferase